MPVEEAVGEASRSRSPLMGIAFLVAAPYLIFGVDPLRAEMSVSCNFALIRGGFEVLKFCGEKIDSKDEARYRELFQKFSAFIASNGGSRFEFETPETLRRLGVGEVCSGSNHDLLVNTFNRSISDEGMAAIDKMLSHPKNPDSGDCL